jgi:hypothetical protein
MRGLSLHGSREQLTFSVSIALLGAIAVAQILAFLYYQTRPSRSGQAISQRKQIEAGLFRQPKIFRPPAPGPINVPAVEGIPPTTVNPVEKTPKTVPETLLRVAKGYRDRGDTTNAIAKLQQAVALDPGNPEVLAELALTYESMQLFHRSNEVWRRLQSLGPAAGPLYQLAALKLQVGVPIQGSVAASGSPSASADGQSSDTAGVPDGSTFGISEVSLRKENDPNAETRLLLRVGVKARPETPIDHTKVKIQVFFYDMVNNDQVVLTDAEVSYEWVTPGHDWSDTGTEVLDVTYYRPKRNDPVPGSSLGEQPIEVPDSVEKAKLAARKPKAGAELLPTSESGPRQYLGYIVRVYYKEQLQAVRADPTRLLNLFPPPFTAPPQ